MSAPLRMSRFELALVVGRLLDGPGFAAMLEALIAYAEASEKKRLAEGNLDAGNGWALVRVTLADLLDEWNEA